MNLGIWDIKSDAWCFSGSFQLIPWDSLKGNPIGLRWFFLGSNFTHSPEPRTSLKGKPIWFSSGSTSLPQFHFNFAETPVSIWERLGPDRHSLQSPRSSQPKEDELLALRRFVALFGNLGGPFFADFAHRPSKERRVCRVFGGEFWRQSESESD